LGKFAFRFKRLVPFVNVSAEVDEVAELVDPASSEDKRALVRFRKKDVFRHHK
jgi:hypothetical protein